MGQKARICTSYRLTLKRVQVTRNFLWVFIMDYSDERQQHIEDTKYLTWADGMYVMLEDLECDYEKALIEGSLRHSVYFVTGYYFDLLPYRMALGVYKGDAGAWVADCGVVTIKLTRAQALYIATGDVTI